MQSAGAIQAVVPRSKAPNRALMPRRLVRGISQVGFGTGSLLRIGSEKQRRSLLAAALAAGITHFDTAPIYGLGESERQLGRFLLERRHEVTLTTKFGLQTSPLAARLAVFQGIARRALRALPALRGAAVRNAKSLYAAPDFSPNSVRSSLEASLRALRTDYVDFFLAHQANVQALPGEDLVGLLEELRRAGKIRAFGVATNLEWLEPVLKAQPELSPVVQFDCELTRSPPVLPHRHAGQLVITYSFIGKAVGICRERLRRQPHHELNRIDDDRLGRLLVRAAVLSNPDGLILMQSRSPARVAGNVLAAHDDRDDEAVARVFEILRSRES